MNLINSWAAFHFILSLTYLFCQKFYHCFASQHGSTFVRQSRGQSRVASRCSKYAFPSLSSWRCQHPGEVSLTPDTLRFPRFWLFLSKRKRPQDPEDKENGSSDDMSKNYNSFGRIYSRQSCPFSNVDSVVNFGIKHEASDDDEDSNLEPKTLTTLWVKYSFDCMLRLTC